MLKTRIKAIGNMIIVRIIKREKTEGGIFIPSTVHQLPQEYAEVLSVGSNVVDKKIDEGSTILFHQRAGQIILHEGEELRVVKEDEIYGIIQREELS